MRRRLLRQLASICSRYVFAIQIGCREGCCCSIHFCSTYTVRQYQLLATSNAKASDLSLFMHEQPQIPPRTNCVHVYDNASISTRVWQNTRRALEFEAIRLIWLDSFGRWGSFFFVPTSPLVDFELYTVPNHLLWAILPSSTGARSSQMYSFAARPI